MHINILNHSGGFVCDPDRFMKRLGLENHPEVRTSICSAEPCDFVVVFNDLSFPRKVIAPVGRIVKAYHERAQFASIRAPLPAIYSKVFTCGKVHDSRYSVEPLLGPNYVGANTQELLSFEDKVLDRIGMAFTHVTLERTAILNKNIPLDYIGKNYANSKAENFKLHKYYLAAENHVDSSYITEKLSDGILLGCHVFYHGPLNAKNFYDPRCFTHVDLCRPEEAATLMREKIREGIYEGSRKFIANERKRLLTEESFVARCLKAAWQLPCGPIEPQVVTV